MILGLISYRELALIAGTAVAACSAWESGKSFTAHLGKNKMRDLTADDMPTFEELTDEERGALVRLANSRFVECFQRPNYANYGWKVIPEPQWDLKERYRIQPGQEGVAVSEEFATASEYRTKNGLDVRIYATDGANNRIHGAVKTSNGWHSTSWSRNLLHLNRLDWDLVKVKQPVVRYFNAYRRGDSITVARHNNSTREEADKHAGPNRIACIRVEFEEGRFDD